MLSRLSCLACHDAGSERYLYAATHRDEAASSKRQLKGDTEKSLERPGKQMKPHRNLLTSQGVVEAQFPIHQRASTGLLLRACLHDEHARPCNYCPDLCSQQHHHRLLCAPSGISWKTGWQVTCTHGVLRACCRDGTEAMTAWQERHLSHGATLGPGCMIYCQILSLATWA